jgi:hypothetical protein
MKIKNFLLFVSVASFFAIAKSQVRPTVSWVNYLSDDPTISSVSTALDANSKVYQTGRIALGTEDIVIQCTDSTGLVLWTYFYDNGAYDSPNKIRVDAAGYTYVTGVSTSTTGLGKDYVVIVLDQTGSLKWASTYDPGAGGGDDEATDILVDNNSDVYITGKSKNSSSDWDVWTLKLNGSSGMINWLHTFSGSGFDDEGICMTFGNSQNDVIIGCNSDNPSSGTDIVVYQLLASSGTAGWQTNINGSANNNDCCTGIILSGGNVVVSGMVNNTTTGEDYLLAKINETSGGSVFQQNYDFSSTDCATSLVKDNMANIAVTGMVYNSVTSNYEYHTNLYDSTGTLYWTNKKRIYCTAVNVAPSIVTDTIAWHFYISGEIENNNSDILVYQLTPGGNIGWEKVFNSPQNGTDVATGLRVNGIGVVFVAAMTINSSGEFDITTMKITQTPVYYPIDYNNANESPAQNCLFYKNTGEILYSDQTSATEVEFYTKNTSPQFFFKKNSLAFLTRSIDSLGIADSTDRIDLTFLEANPFSEIFPFETQNDGYLNYFKPYCGGAAGITNVKGSRRLMIPEIYRGIDLHYYSNKDGLKFYFVVKPSFSSNEIQMNLDGNIISSLNVINELNITSSLSNFTFKAPKFYNVFATVTGTNVTFTTTAVSGTLNNVSGDNYNFLVGTYNQSWPLVIEMEQKTVGLGISSECDWSTFYGGSGIENVNKITTDGSGNSFITGQTDSPNFPGLTGGFSTSTSGKDGFITKLNSNGSPAWGTFYGGSAVIGAENCVPFGIDVNSNGEVYIAGYTDNNSISLVPAANSSLNGSTDAFVAKFNSSGNSLLFARYFGGSGDDKAKDLCIDGNDNLFIGGSSGAASGFPFANPGSGAYFQNTSADNNDAFISEFNSSNTLLWSTKFGGGSADEFQSIKVLANGNVLTSGITASSTRATSNSSNPLCGVPLSSNDYPDCVPGGSYSQSYGGWTADNIIAEFTSSGALAWSTYYGSTFTELTAKIVLNPINSNEFYIVGSTSTKNGNLTMGPAGSYQQNFPNVLTTQWPRGYITKFSYRQPVWHTLIGEGSQVFVEDGVCDNNGNVYLCGRVQTSGYTTGTPCQPILTANQTDFPLCHPSGVFKEIAFSGGSWDAFLMSFDYNDVMVWSTFYGGASTDEGMSLALDVVNNKICFAGNTQSGASAFPLFDPATGNYQQNANAGSANSMLYPTANTDAFFAKLCLASVPVGVKESDRNELFDNAILFPNPNTGYFEVSLAGVKTGVCDYEIHDLTGRIIESGSKHFTEKNLKFSLLNKKYSSGIYLLRINSAEKSGSFKFIIE